MSTSKMSRYTMDLSISDVEACKLAIDSGGWIHSWDGAGWTVDYVWWSDDGFEGLMRVRRKLDFTFNSFNSRGWEQREVVIRIVV